MPNLNPNAPKMMTNAQQSVFEAIDKLTSDTEKMLFYSEIISKSGYSRTSVITAIKLLSAFNLIQITKPDCKKQNLPYTYKVNRT
ncbi:MAG: hypothetical protein RIT27_829 [Pseudomonadota bacterium]|jgi:hypothetical protein